MTTNNNDMSKLLRDSSVSSFLWKPRSRCAGSAMNVLSCILYVLLSFLFLLNIYGVRSLIFIVIAAQNQISWSSVAVQVMWYWTMTIRLPLSLSVCLSVEGNQFLVHTRQELFSRTVLTLNILWLIVGQLFHNNCRKGDWKLCCLRNLTLGHLIYTSAHTLE